MTTILCKETEAMIEIDAQPTMNPLGVPAPKPSEIVRNWPDAMWGTKWAKIKSGETGAVHFCAIGILGETGGHEWGDPWATNYHVAMWDGHYASAVAEFVGTQHDLTPEQLNRLIGVNDSQGKDAAADLLASWGM